VTSDEDDDDEFENALSLAAMEAELKPKVLETFDRIARQLQEAAQAPGQDDRAAGRRRRSLAPAASVYEKLREEIIKDVKSLSLNNNRIESLVEQLYAINKPQPVRGPLDAPRRQLRRVPTGLPRRILRQRARPDLARADVRSGKKNWLKLVNSERHRIDELRAEIHELASVTGLEIPSSAASCATSRRASARPGRPKRRWSRPTSAW
jgi:RNA polymerase primary sigma factor